MQKSSCKEEAIPLEARWLSCKDRGRLQSSTAPTLVGACGGQPYGPKYKRKAHNEKAPCKYFITYCPPFELPPYMSTQFHWGSIHSISTRGPYQTFGFCEFHTVLMHISKHVGLYLT